MSGWDVFERYSSTGDEEFSVRNSRATAHRRTTMEDDYVMHDCFGSSGRSGASSSLSERNSVSEDETMTVVKMLGPSHSIHHMGWVEKVQEEGRGSTQMRLIVITAVEVISLKRTMSGSLHLQRRGHLFDLQTVGHVKGSKEVVALRFKDFSLAFNATSRLALSLLQSLERAISGAWFGRPVGTLPTFAKRTRAMLDRLNDKRKTTPLQLHVAAYSAMCAYRRCEPRASILEHFKSLLSDIEDDGPDGEGRALSLSRCFPQKTRHDHLLCLEPLLRGSPFLAGVELHGTRISALAVEYLCGSIAANRATRKLVLRNSGLSGAKHLASIRTLGGSLTYLDLSYSSLGEVGATHLSDALQGLERPPAPKSFDEGHSLTECDEADGRGACVLETLRLSHCDLSGGALSHLRSHFQTRAWARSLRTLDLSGNSLGAKGTEVLAAFAGVAGALESLMLADCALCPPAAIFAALAANKRAMASLRLFDVSGNPLATAGDAPALSAVLQASRGWCSMIERFIRIVHVRMDPRQATHVDISPIDLPARSTSTAAPPRRGLERCRRGVAPAAAQQGAGWSATREAARKCNQRH
jgi:hypothetical protein